jgi:hypothetical protein
MERQAMNHANQLNQEHSHRREIDKKEAEMLFSAYQKSLALYHYKAMANEACNEAARSV